MPLPDETQPHVVPKGTGKNGVHGPDVRLHAELDLCDVFDMTHALQNCQKLKLLHVMVVPVFTVNGLNGLSALPNVQVVFPVVCNTMTVDLIPLSRNAHVVLTDGLTGHYGPAVHPPVSDRD